MASVLDRLAAHVSKPHFPLVIFLLAVANTFAVFLSGALTALFVSTCAAWGKPRFAIVAACNACLLYTSPSPRDLSTSRMPSSA